MSAMLNTDRSDDIPNILGCIAEFSARYAGAEAVIADTDRIVFDMISKVIVAFRHRSNKDTNALIGS